MWLERDIGVAPGNTQPGLGVKGIRAERFPPRFGLTASKRR
mgnify:CR=1 FL=1